jgi:hypothetical protein
VVIRDHHKGFTTWEVFEANQHRLAQNNRPRPHQTGGAVREGAALLQGLAKCGRCGRGLRVYYSGRHSTPGYHCPGSALANGRAEYCLRIGGRHVDEAVATSFLSAIAPAGLAASLKAVEQIEADHDSAVAQFRRDVERARFEVQRAERRYRAVDPDNRLVARGLEAEWEKCLRQLEACEAELRRREETRPRALTPQERESILALGHDIGHVWSAPTTTDRDRKELLRTLLEEILIDVQRDESVAHLTMRWRGGLLTELDVPLLRSKVAPIRTDEETVALVRRLATHYPDAVIAGILNRQERLTATGMRFIANRVCSLRTHWGIPRFESPSEQPDGKLVTIDGAAEALGVAPSTVHRWLNDGFIAGEQDTLGAPWRIRLTEDLRARFVERPPTGYVPMSEATRILAVSRQTVLQRVKRGELKAVHVRSGRRQGLRIQVPDPQPSLFDRPQSDGGVL